MVPPQAISSCVRWSYCCLCLLLMVSWQVSYLAKGYRPDFNNSTRGDSNSGPILVPGVYSNLTRITAPPRPSQSCVTWSYIRSCLLLMVSWQVPYLAKGCRPDFNNGLRGDSNSDPILVHRRLFESDSNNGPTPGHSNTERKHELAQKLF